MNNVLIANRLDIARISLEENCMWHTAIDKYLLANPGIIAGEGEISGFLSYVNGKTDQEGNKLVEGPKKAFELRGGEVIEVV